MKKLIFIIAAVVAIATAACSSSDDDMSRLYKASATANGRLTACHGQKPALETAADTVSYYMGYINGAGLNELLNSGQAPQDILNMDKREFMQGLSMAFAADSADISLLQGIAMGIQLRQMRDALNRDTPMEWDNDLVMQGYYQGVVQDRDDHLPAQMAQEKLMEARYRMFMQTNAIKQE